MTNNQQLLTLEQKIDALLGESPPGSLKYERKQQIIALIDRVVTAITPEKKVITKFKKGDVKELVVFAEEKSFNQAIDQIKENWKGIKG